MRKILRDCWIGSLRRRRLMTMPHINKIILIADKAQSVCRSFWSLYRSIFKFFLRKILFSLQVMETTIYLSFYI